MSNGDFTLGIIPHYYSVACAQYDPIVFNSLIGFPKGLKDCRPFLFGSIVMEMFVQIGLRDIRPSDAVSATITPVNDSIGYETIELDDMRLIKVIHAHNERQALRNAANKTLRDAESFWNNKV